MPRTVDEDPLARAIAPPPDETPEERKVRLRAESEAKRVSDAIDEELKRPRIAKKVADEPVKVLLLGQSESDKSTILKSFHLMSSSNAFDTERASWRTVIQLNVIRSFRLIVDAMSNSQTGSPHLLDNDDVVSVQSLSELPAVLVMLAHRLDPLFQIEDALRRRLHSTYPSYTTSVAENDTHLKPITDVPVDQTPNLLSESSVDSTVPWKGCISRLFKNGGERDYSVDLRDPNDPVVVFNRCSQDMIYLWNSPTIRALLRARKMRLEDMPVFFLDCLDRVTSSEYVPSDDDILRAHLRTPRVGVSEHRFVLNTPGDFGIRDLRIFDVGGHRSLRAAWVPYLDNVDVIIFVAPISCFDQVLVENPSVNQLEDSVLLWKEIVSNPLLQNTGLILILNKCDILKDKLAAGIRLADYLTSYGDRPNDLKNASDYWRRRFTNIQKEFSPVKRMFYCRLTSVVDTTTTRAILRHVQDMLLRKRVQVLTGCSANVFKY